LKKRVLDFLVCPACKGHLRLEVFEEYHNSGVSEVSSGLLTCKCGEWYPIINGVPRMLKAELKNTIINGYKEFFHKFRASLPPFISNITLTFNDKNSIDKKQRTIYSFGYEWTEFADYKNENFREWLAGSPPDSFFSGKVGLEAGCGAGRHTMTAVSLGAEMFAVDLSNAVDAAYRKNINSPNAHIIQADIYALPFQKSIFDFAYCLGVIQHLPDPPSGFLILSSYVRPNGAFFVNVYAKGRISWPVLKTMRFFTTHLPNKFTKTLSFAFTLLDYVVIGPYKIFSRIDFVKPVLDFIVWERTRAYAELDFQANYTDWFDRLAAPLDIRYGKEDVLNWYKNAGFSDIMVIPLRKAFWNGAGKRPFHLDTGEN